MEIKPDFYLVSSEYIPHIGPVECYVRSALEVDEINYLVVDLIPGLYGDNEERNTVIIGPRYIGDNLMCSERWPVYINVFIPKSNNFKDIHINALSDLTIIAWAEIHKTKNDSLKALQ